MGEGRVVRYESVRTLVACIDGTGSGLKVCLQKSVACRRLAHPDDTVFPSSLVIGVQ